MRKLTFFSKREPLYVIEGNSLLTDFAIVILQEKKEAFKYIKKEKNNSFKFYENYFLPERLAKYIKNKKYKSINYTLITENFILPLTNNYLKFKKRIKNIVSEKEINEFEKKLKNLNNINSFSYNFLKIIQSIFIIYGFFDLKKLDFKILKDFFSNNYIVNNFSFEIKNSPNIEVKNKKVIKVTDAPAKYETKQIKLNIYKINKTDIYFPELVVFYIDNPILIKFPEIITFSNNDLDIEKIFSFISKIYPSIKSIENFIEKKEIKSYKGLLSRDKNYLGKFCLVPYHPYDLLNSVWRFINEKKGNE